MHSPSRNVVVPTRNARLLDRWSIVHTFTGIAFGFLLPPLVAWVIMAAWEPFEVLVLSPLLMKRGVVFGYEAWPNSLSDIAFDSLGIACSFTSLHALDISTLFLK